MSKINLFELLQQDLEDLKGLFNYKDYGLTEEQMKRQAKAIVANLEDHLEDLIKK